MPATSTSLGQRQPDLLGSDQDAEGDEDIDIYQFQDSVSAEKQEESIDIVEDAVVEDNPEDEACAEPTDEEVKAPVYGRRSANSRTSRRRNSGNSESGDDEADSSFETASGIGASSEESDAEEWQDATDGGDDGEVEEKNNCM